MRTRHKNIALGPVFGLRMKGVAKGGHVYLCIKEYKRQRCRAHTRTVPRSVSKDSLVLGAPATQPSRAFPLPQPRGLEPAHLLRPSLGLRERDLCAVFGRREAALALDHAVAQLVVLGLDLLLEQGWVEVVGFGGGVGGGGVGAFDDCVGVDGFGVGGCWRAGWGRWAG